MLLLFVVVLAEVPTVATRLLSNKGCGHLLCVMIVGIYSGA